MIAYDPYRWWKSTFSWRGTALPLALSRGLIFLLYAILIQALSEYGADAGWISEVHFLGIDPAGHAVLGSLIGFLIVFRINASNTRWWEGRTLWGALINNSRNLVRFASQHCSEPEELARLITGYVMCLRRGLQGFRDLGEADLYLSDDVAQRISRFGNLPTGISQVMSEWITARFRRQQLDSIMLRHMEELLNRLVDAQGGCERIQKTPLPFVYVAMIRQLILIYLLTLPVVLCERCGWWSPVLLATISLGMFGLEEAGVETEDPFGLEDNCLDLVACTMTIARDTAQLATSPATETNLSEGS